MLLDEPSKLNISIAISVDPEIYCLPSYDDDALAELTDLAKQLLCVFIGERR